jgi:hypothetical protein
MNSTRTVCLFGTVLAALGGSAMADRITIVSEDKVAEIWIPALGTARVIAGFPTSSADPSQDVCVNIGFLINKDGSTSNFTQMKAWSSRTPDQEAKPELVQPFVQSAAAAVSLWHFAPAKDKPKPIYTSASFSFEGSKTLSGDQIRARCRIDDLQEFVAEAKRKSDSRGNLAKSQAERQEAMRQTQRQHGDRMTSDYTPR